MSKSTNDKIDEIILKPAHWQLDDYTLAKSRLIQLIKETLQECIGEEEKQLLPHPKLDNYDATQRCVGRNQLRKEAYKKLEELLK